MITVVSLILGRRVPSGCRKSKIVLNFIYTMFFPILTGSVYSMNMLDKGMIHILGRTERGGVRFHHTIHLMVHNLKLMNCLFLEFSV